MKYTLIFTLLAGICLSFCMKSNNTSLTTTITHQQTINHSLLDLLTLLDISHDGTLSSIVRSTQEAWLRKPGTERWHIQEQYNNQKEVILPLCHKLQLAQEIKPTKTHYDYALLLGAALPRVRCRLAYLLELWNQGIRFDKLIILAGQRPLDASLENESELLNVQTQPNLPTKQCWHLEGSLPTTEAQMMAMVLDQIELPADFNARIELQVTPMITKADGTVVRPTTGDTISTWLATQPMPGSIIAFSNQPFVGYQHSVLLTYLPGNFTVQTVGEQIDHNNLNVAVILDTLARWIYQEQIRTK